MSSSSSTAVPPTGRRSSPRGRPSTSGWSATSLPTAVVDLGRRLARGDVVCVANGRSLFGRSCPPAVPRPGRLRGRNGGRDGAGGLGPGRDDELRSGRGGRRPLGAHCPTGHDLLVGRAPKDERPSVGSKPAVRCWEYVPATPSALARECYRAGATNPRLDHRIALPAILVVGSALAGGRSRRWRRVAVPAGPCPRLRGARGPEWEGSGGCTPSRVRRPRGRPLGDRCRLLPPLGAPGSKGRSRA